MKLPQIVIFFLLSVIIHAQQTPDEIGREWIKKNINPLKVNSENEFILRASRNSLSGHTLRYQQTINSVPVYDTEVTIHISNKNKVTHVANNYDKKVLQINTAPTFFKTSAIEIAKSYLKAEEPISREESKLYVYNKTGVTKLVYIVTIKANLPVGLWQVIMDAKSSEVIEAKEISNKYHSKPSKTKKNTKPDHSKKKKKSSATSLRVDGTGMVFDPDPLSTSGQTYGIGGYIDNNDASSSDLDAARTSVELRGIDLTDGIYTLKGRYVEIQDVEAPNKGLFTQTTPDFNFNRNDDGFEAVNCYYHLDKNLRYINETLGIRLTSLYNNGVLVFDPSGWNGADQSSYGAGQLIFGEGGVDDAEDADVILHELGHGLHDWVTNGSLSQVEALSEGCGDYWAQSYKRSLEQWHPTDPSHHHVFGWDGHNEYWNGRTTNYEAAYPTELISGFNHINGQIWSTSLMRVFDIIGREKTDKAFLEGIGMTNSNSNQQDAAIAVRQAAIDMGYSCAEINVFTTEFTATGYALPDIKLSINCLENQVATLDCTGTTYTIPDYTEITNVISKDCNATLTQEPKAGIFVSEGIHTINLTASSPSSEDSVFCSFNLTVNPLENIENCPEENTDIVLFPIPVDDNLFIRGKLENDNIIEIFNVIGKKSLEAKIDINENLNTIDVSSLSSGVYFVSFKGQNKVEKIVKN